MAPRARCCFRGSCPHAPLEGRVSIGCLVRSGPLGPCAARRTILALHEASPPCAANVETPLRYERLNRVPVLEDSGSNIVLASDGVKGKRDGGSAALALDYRDAAVHFEHDQPAFFERGAPVLAQGLEQLLVADALLLQALLVDVAAIDEDPRPPAKELLHLAAADGQPAQDPVQPEQHERGGQPAPERAVRP